jgi:hypothetical protein
MATRLLMRFGPAVFALDEQNPLSAEAVIEERRRALPIGGDLGEMLDSLDGRTTDQACDLIVGELGADE